MNNYNGIKFGFSPANTAEENSAALKKALEHGGKIVIDEPGVYEIRGGNIIYSDTELVFGNNVFLKKVPDKQRAYAFINAGAYTKEYDCNISLTGLNLIVNNVRADRNAENFILGMICQVGFHFIKNLVIKDFTCLDLEEDDFGIQVCTFENAVFENCRIEGLKDGIHLGAGKGFVIRGCDFRTFDDPIAINANDYVTSNPQFGWIEDGLIENCREFDQPSTVGYFCRFPGGCWGNWYENMVVQNSDKAVWEGRVYIVNAKPDGNFMVSKFPPTHTSGKKTYPDGITWSAAQKGILYNCGSRNIRFNNISLEKNREVAFAFTYGRDNWERSCYPGAKPESFGDFVFENVRNEKQLEMFLWSIVPMKSVTLKNCVLTDCNVHFAVLDEVWDRYPEVNVIFDGCTFVSSGEKVILSNDPRRKVNAVFKNTVLSGGIIPQISGEINIVSSDIEIRKEENK